MEEFGLKQMRWRTRAVLEKEQSGAGNGERKEVGKVREILEQ